jgi:predicted metal-dependent hydrolase
MPLHGSFPVRNLKFELSGAVPRFWLAGQRSVTAFFNNLSVFFPAGEHFFISAVREHREAITDPQLAADARAFYGQEGVHSREHERYNQMLRAQGYPIAELEGRVEEILAWVTENMSPIQRLAITAGLEHFTALLAHWLLSTPALLDGADPELAALWRWHAAEENEHKSVAFDVFQAAGGTYIDRISLMALATAVFLGKVAEYQVRLMQTDGIASSVREWKQLYDFLFTRGRLHALIPHYFAYYLPGFKPWQLDNRNLVEEWKAEVQAA